MRVFMLALLSIALAVPTQAQIEDAEGCADPHLLTRMPGYYIEQCSENYNEADFQTAPGEAQTFEGNVIRVRYAFQDASTALKPSPIQVVRNYQNALAAKGAKTIYNGDDEIGTGFKSGTFQVMHNNVLHWIRIGDMYGNENEVSGYVLTILAEQPMEQEVTANVISEQLDAAGRVSLNIQFDTGKSTLKQESNALLDNLAAVLKNDPSLQIIIEGHTDNAGNAAANKALSLQRAQAVAKALSSRGIEANRMSTEGFGHEKPVADNGTEEGRARNRRVDIVKK